MVNFYLNSDAVKSLAREIRLASWGASAVTATVVFKENSGWALSMGVLCWVALQVLAFIVESTKVS